MLDETAQITTELRQTGQYTQVVDSGPQRDTEVARIRSLGRKVARDCGWKVQTLVAPRGAAADRPVRVFIVIREGGTSPLHEQLLEKRRAAATRRAMRALER